MTFPSLPLLLPHHLPASPLPLLSVLFLGSDQFSISTLDPLYRSTGLWDRLEVMTTGEKVVGRGGKGRGRPPLRDWAIDRGLKTHEVPESGMEGWEPPPSFPTPSPHTLLITSSFGHILPTPLLRHHFPLPHTRLNVHPSLLPRYRGAAPIQRAIMNGEKRTGVVVQSLSWEGVDKGEIWGMEQGVVITPTDTYPTLLPRLSTIAGSLLLNVLLSIQRSTHTSTPQDPAVESTRAPKITRKTAKVDFQKWDAGRVERTFKGIGYHQPLWTEIRGKEVQLLDISTTRISNTPWLSSLSPGQGLISKFPSLTNPSSSHALTIRCASSEDHPTTTTTTTQTEEERVVVVRRVKQVNGREMDVRDWGNGMRVGKGEIIDLE